jgi:DNA-binding IclR family transcriptional regulator
VKEKPKFSPSASPMFIGSVQKCFEVLEALGRIAEPQTLTQLVELTGIEKSAVQRLTSTLVELGYLYKDDVSKQYRIGAKLLPLSYTYLRTEPFVAFAVPYLRDLSADLNQTVNLTVLERAEVIYVSRFAGPSPVSLEVQIGARRPAYCTAMGRAILSRLPAARVNDILDASDIRAFTRHTLTKRADIQREIKRAAQKGFAITSQELLLNDLSIAVALDLRSDLRAAINVSMKLDRVSREQAEKEVVPKIVATAHAISMYSTQL